MILCDREIQEALDQQRIVVLPPPAADHFASTSLDLRLGARLDLWKPPGAQKALGLTPKFCPADEEFIYKRIEKQWTEPWDLNSKAYDLPCQGFVLGYTAESIYLPHRSRLCARVEGKSSLARLGLGVHVTAPTIHAGFGFNEEEPEKSGAPLRLEIWNVGPLPIELRAGMRICQVILEEVREMPTTGYGGQFNRQGPAGL